MCDGGLDSPKLSAIKHQQESIQSTGHTGQSSCDDESQSEDGEWYPGDEICPPSSQFYMCYQANFDIWRKAASTLPEGSGSVWFYAENFLNMLEEVPLFFHNPPKGISITGGAKSPFILRSSLHLKTTDDPSCDQRLKSIDYLQCLGFPAPAVYRTKAETQLSAVIPVTPAYSNSGYFTSIVLAWSYIVSCRWVEILRQAGEKSSMLHDRRANMSFWDMVTQSRWVARVKSRNATYYSPWMLREEGKDPFGLEEHRDLKLVSPDSSLAFDHLLEFCASKGFEGELFLGLASVLMLPSRNTPPPKFAPPAIIFRPAVCCSHKDKVFHRVYNSLDKCISLSSTQDALDSLLCSAFFDPCIPCNFVGAASLGIREALLVPDEIGSRQLLNAITGQKPHLSLLWAAVICSGQAISFLSMALKRLPPLCLVAACWTNTVQSFLQVAYYLDDPAESIISRANEFQVSYFCRPHVTVPWSAVPPFGTTTVQNLSLDVRAHLRHGHKPHSWMIYWITNSGVKVPAGAQHRLKLGQTHNIQCYHTTSEETPQHPHFPERHVADEQSWSATSRLFNWHRHYDDGLWLDDGSTAIEVVRRLQMHPWIVDQLDDGQCEQLGEDKHREPNWVRILEWTADVEKHRPSEEIATA